MEKKKGRCVLCGTLTGPVGVNIFLLGVLMDRHDLVDEKSQLE